MRGRECGNLVGGRSRPLLRGAGGNELFAFALLTQSDFLTVHHDVARRLDPQANLTAIDGHHRDFYLLADAQRLAGPSGQYQHISQLSSFDVTKL